jgi:hypothetical protein
VKLISSPTAGLDRGARPRHGKHRFAAGTYMMPPLPRTCLATRLTAGAAWPECSSEQRSHDYHCKLSESVEDELFLSLGFAYSMARSARFSESNRVARRCLRVERFLPDRGFTVL